MILERASGSPVYQLDLWMAGEAHCRELLHDAALDADIIIIEGVMGLFDGDPSSADLASRFGIPALVLINAGAMAQTFGAIAHGLATFRPGIPLLGVAANHVATEAHAEMLREALPADIRWLGAIPRGPEFALPNRHLGLVQAGEIADLDGRINAAAAAIDGLPLTVLPPPVSFTSVVVEPTPRALEGVTIGVARDLAFAFIYAANLDLLRRMGAELTFFSPLEDRAFGSVDALYLPGGYPELHLEQLAANRDMVSAIRAHHKAGKSIYAECGGMLYLLESLTHKDGTQGEMVGLIPGHGKMQPRLTALGFQSVGFPAGRLRGHTFHHSTMEVPLKPSILGDPLRPGRTGEAVFQLGPLTASYLHLYFPSNAGAAASLFISSPIR